MAQDLEGDNVDWSSRFEVVSNKYTGTGSNTVYIAHTWTIDKFSRYSADTIDGFPSMESDKFSVSLSYGQKSDKRKFTFQLVLRPRGVEGFEDFVSVSLRMVKCDLKKKLPVLFEFSLFDDKEHTRGSKSLMANFTQEESFCSMHDFIRRETLFEPDSHLLPNGTLIVFCQVNILLSKAHPDLFDKSFVIFSKQQSHMLSPLLESGIRSDIVLVVEDGKHEFRAHKLLLAAASPVFESLFEFDKQENDNRVNLPEVKADVFKLVLDFIYKGEVEMSQKHVAELFLVADKYQIDWLKTTSESWLCDNFSSIQSCTRINELFRVANTCNSAKLKATLMAFIRKQSHKVLDEILSQEDMALYVYEFMNNLRDNSN